MKNFFNKITNKIAKRIIPYSIWGIDSQKVDLEIMKEFDIAECGIDKDDAPFIRLKTEEIFFSFLPTEYERNIFRKYKTQLPKNLKEDCIRVAFDISQRYCRENGLGHIPSKSYHVYPGWGFIDLGAYLGFGSIKLSRKVGTNGKVIAVEASPTAYSLLLKNIEANQIKNIQAVHAAVQDKNGRFDFFQTEKQNNSIYPNLKDHIHFSKIKHSNAVEVTCKTLDTIIEETQYPIKSLNTLVSFEINGAEFLALKGGKNFLTYCPSYCLKVGARYGSGDGNSIKEQILNFLGEYPDLFITDSEPYIFATRYPENARDRFQ